MTGHVDFTFPECDVWHLVKRLQGKGHKLPEICLKLRKRLHSFVETSCHIFLFCKQYLDTREKRTSVEYLNGNPVLFRILNIFPIFLTMSILIKCTNIIQEQNYWNISQNVLWFDHLFWIFSVAGSTFTNVHSLVCLFVHLSSKPFNSLKSSSFILHHFSFLLSSFRNF